MPQNKKLYPLLLFFVGLVVLPMICMGIVLASISAMGISTQWAGVFSAAVEYRESVARLRGALATLAQQKEFAYLLSEHCVKDAQCTTRSKQFVDWIEVLYGCI